MMLPKQFIFGLISLIIKCTGGNEGCAASIRGACPSPWIQWGGNCYKAIAEPLTWFEAREECSKMGSVLVVPESDDESAFLLSLEDSFWINCFDLKVEGTGSWVCQDGSTNVNYRNWAKGEPNNVGQREHCAAVRYLGWNVLPCEYRYPAICKQLAPQLHL